MANVLDGESNRHTVLQSISYAHNDRVTEIEKKVALMEGKAFLDKIPGLLDRVQNYTEEDICRLLDGPKIVGHGRRAWNIQRDGPGRWGVAYHWNPPSGVSAVGCMTSWSVLPDDFHDPMLVKANRIEVVVNLARIMHVGIVELISWIEESRHPLEQLARETL